MKKIIVVIVSVIIASLAFAGEVKVKIQPSSSAGVDKYFGSYYDTLGVNNEFLRVGGWGDSYISLIKFNDANKSLPKELKRAELWLYGTNIISPTAMGVYRLTSSWSELLWDHQNLTGYYLGVAPSPSVGNGWYALDITDVVKIWRSDPSSNKGLCFLPRQTDNKFNFFVSSDSKTSSLRPILYLVYDVTVPISVRWPLSSKKLKINHVFGEDWARGTRGGDGLLKKHAGTDYATYAGTAVYPALSGIVKYSREFDSWGYVVVLEHNNPNGGKFCTVYWHVTGSTKAIGANVTESTQISSVANLEGNTHFHFGVWIGSFENNITSVGALPVTTGPDAPGGMVYPAFPYKFINPEDTSKVVFR